MSLPTLLLQLRPDRAVWAPGEFQRAIVWIAIGCSLAYAVFRLVPRVPWPRPFRWQFAAFHMVAAPLAALTWSLVSLSIEVPMGWSDADFGPRDRFGQMTVFGSMMYVLIASLSYSAHGSARAAQAEAVAARTQLATLRSQLQPHFLFNALHTIVQLIHIDPARAASAAELVADLLRRTLEEQRDEVPLQTEWRFVSRYLAIEQMRFGERLIINAALPEELEAEQVPSFSLQTLVENAVQHGAAPRIEPTRIDVTVERRDGSLVITVRNSPHSHEPVADRAPDQRRVTEAVDLESSPAGTATATASSTAAQGTGTGLARLRQRLSVLYGGTATLTSGPLASGGYEAVLAVPRNRPEDA